MKNFLETWTQPKVQDFKYMSLLERVTYDDPERQKRLRNIGILSQYKELSHDFYQSNCLERCFVGADNIQLMNSADILIDHMLKFKSSESFSIRNMLVAILPNVTVGMNKKGNISKQYIKFFLDKEEQDHVLNEHQEYEVNHQCFEQ